jgi:RNA polymerase sigma-70 factor, ECF subfamily
VETILELQNGIRQHRLVFTPSVIEISDDATLANAAREGDRVAFGRLYERYSRMVHGILLTRIPRPDVDDLVHDVFLMALRQIRTLRNSSAFGGWLAMIARNRATDYHRSTPEVTELAEDFPGEDLAQAEAILILEKIRSLPEAYRETLILRLVEGMTGPEIAERTGLTAASVRVNLHRGMKQLREKLERRNVHE